MSFLDALGGSSSSDEDESLPPVIRDAWVTTEGRAVFALTGTPADWIAIVDSPSVLRAAQPRGLEYLAMPLLRQKQVRTEPVDDSRPDLVLPAVSFSGEEIEPAGVIDAGEYEVIAVRDGRTIDTHYLTVHPEAVPDD
jgi:hypothetical protein